MTSYKGGGAQPPPPHPYFWNTVNHKYHKVSVFIQGVLPILWLSVNQNSNKLPVHSIGMSEQIPRDKKYNRGPKSHHLKLIRSIRQLFGWLGRDTKNVVSKAWNYELSWLSSKKVLSWLVLLMKIPDFHISVMWLSHIFSPTMIVITRNFIFPLFFPRGKKCVKVSWGKKAGRQQLSLTHEDNKSLLINELEKSPTNLNTFFLLISKNVYIFYQNYYFTW